MLSKEYGKYKSFKDKELFDKIAQLSSPKIREFFTKYVEGSQPLPLKEILAKVGITYQKNAKVKEISMGGVALGFNRESNRLYVMDIGSMDNFGKKLGFKVNDELIAINGVTLTNDNMQDELDKFKTTTKIGDKVTITVARKTKGVTKNKKLKAKAISVEKTKKYYIAFNPSATKQQLQLQKAWLNQ